MQSNRSFTRVLFLILALLGCRALTGPYRLESTRQAVLVEATETVHKRETLEVLETEAVQSPRVTPLPLATRTLTQTPPSEVMDEAVDFDVVVHPDGGLFAGDRVSFEVIAPPGVDLDNGVVTVAVPGDEPFSQAQFAEYGIAHRVQATLRWAWDTRALEPGYYDLLFTVDPGGLQWVETFTLQPADSLPPGLAQVTWAQARNDCCTVYYIDGTAASRDLESLLAEIDLQAYSVSKQLAADTSDPVPITLLPRLLGHGGFAGGEIHISYLDRNYTGGLPEMVIHHELVHVLDASLGEGYRPSLIVEGLAVYLTGGHYKPEALSPRAAALLDTYGDPPQPGLGWYIPLESLADNFYFQQHEIGYLQAGALIEYLIQTWGWEAFTDFYADIEERSRPSRSLDEAFQDHYGLSLADLESQFIKTLGSQPYNTALLADVRLTVQQFDAVRRYQQMLDPSAYFMTAWLLDSKEMRAQEIVADYTRPPNELENVVLELLLANAGEAIVNGQYTQAEQVIAAVNAVLDALGESWRDPFSASLLAVDTAAVVQQVSINPEWIGASSSLGVSIQRLWIDAGQARVWVTADGDERLQEILLERVDGGAWQFLNVSFK